MVLLKSFDIAGLLAEECSLNLGLVIGEVMVIAQSHLSGAKSSIPMGVSMVTASIMIALPVTLKAVMGEKLSITGRSLIQLDYTKVLHFAD